MDKQLELEAEKYGYEKGGFMSEQAKAFIAGAKYGEKKKLEFAIEENKSILNMLKLHSGDERLMLPCIWRIKELEQKLSDL